MKTIPAVLFNELKKQAARIDVGWLVVRADGQQFGFTSSDIEFTLDGVTYSPTNGFNASAVVSKADASVDNMEMQVLDNTMITEEDLRGGVWNNAQVNVFWVCPDHPEYGVVPLRGGKLGEITIQNGQWKTQLRSLFQQMQQPFGIQYTLTCQAQLGDQFCKVKLDVPQWEPNHDYRLGLLTDAGLGAVVRPTADSDFWYVANYTTETVWGLGYGGLYSGPVVAIIGGGGGSGGTQNLSLTGNSGANAHGESVMQIPRSSNVRTPTQPGQGLSANDDAGPNDNTQVAVGPAPGDLNQFKYQGRPVDIFGIKI